MLKQLLMLLLLSSTALAEDLHRPEKLTVALSDELLGQLGPDGKRLYFVSNRNSTSQIFFQDLDAPASTLLFDEAADNTGPRLSPDGKRLAYVSFRDDATGRLCVRELLRLDHPRCLDEGGALEASWVDAHQLLVLRRQSQEGDLALERVDVGSSLRATPYLQRNLTGPAVSPDGRWLAFVPVEKRGDGKLGAGFSAQAAHALTLRRLDSGDETTVRFDLPGVTGQPAFSVDGKWLYFTQYPNDTDENGALDADDHGVIFRVPFGGDPKATTAVEPTQLTSASWNCQYPSPAKDRLILTCSRSGSLDVFSLPLGGVVPEAWTPARVREEADASRDDWDRILLVHRLEHAEQNRVEKAKLTLEIIRLHLQLGEFESAQFHVRELAEANVPELSSLAVPLQALVDQRRALRAFDHGLIGQQFLERAKQRLEAIGTVPPGEPANTTALRRLVESELLDDIGDKLQSQGALDKAALDASAPAFVVELKAARAEALFREIDRPDLLMATLAPLTTHASLDENAKLRLAGVYTRALTRGLGAADAHAAIAREQARTDERSPIGFQLALAACLESVTPKTLEAGRRCMSALYEQHRSIERRRVLVRDVLAHAEDTDADDLEYELVKRWVADVPKGSAERRHAERSFRYVVEDYAYGALARGKPDEAAAEFQLVTEHALSLESHVGLIEAWLESGHTDVEARYQKRYRPDSAIGRFVHAYLAVRKMPELDDVAFDRAYAQARADVLAVEKMLPQQAEVHALHGVLLHLRFLRGTEAAAAERANLHYLLALDLSTKNARYRAMLLEELALLHAAVGNHRIAIGHFEERAKLPFADPRLELGHQLLYARSLLHVGREADAAKATERALALVDQTSPLERFRPLALDRAALYALAAGDGKRSEALYDRAEPTLAHAGNHDRNRAVFALARAAASIGAGHADRALADLDRADRALVDPAVQKALGWPEVGPDEVRLTYELLRLGLRGQAEHALGRLDDAARTLGERHRLLFARFKQRNLDDDLQSLSLAESQLAELARARKRSTEAAQLASQALDHADQYAKRTATPLADAQLSVLLFSAELVVHGETDAKAFDFDLPARLRAAFDRLSETRSPERFHVRRRLGVYLTLLGMDGIR